MLVCGRCGYYNSDIAHRCEQCNHRLNATNAEPERRPPSTIEVLEPTAEMPAVATRQYAYGGFWQRAGALIIDSVVIGFGLTLALIVLPPSLGLLVLFAGPAAYEVAAETSTGATLGKKVFGLRVLTTGFQPLTFGRALGRYFAHFLSYFFFIGYFIVLFNDEKRALHDYIAGTVVVRDRT